MAPAPQPAEPRHHNILVIGTGENRLPDYSLVYRSIAKQGNARVLELTQREAREPRRSLKHIDFSQYTQVLIDIPFKHLYKAALFLRNIPGLVIYEQDACQNFISGSKWHGEFERFYKFLPHARFALTGFRVSERFRKLGLDAHFVPKGFDEEHLSIRHVVRDIPAGFVGRIRSDVYAERAQLLESLSRSHDVSLLRTQSRSEYCETLNRIGVFVSADIGLGEYMAKNFEAMACGCALLAYRQGQGEEKALGLIDMENVALYSTLAEAEDKLNMLQNDPALRDKIATAGQKLAWKNYTFDRLAARLYELVASTETTVAPPLRLKDRLKIHFRFLS